MDCSSVIYLNLIVEKHTVLPIPPLGGDVLVYLLESVYDGSLISCLLVLRGNLFDLRPRNIGHIGLLIFKLH